jgi:hypothetical protein
MATVILSHSNIEIVRKNRKTGKGGTIEELMRANGWEPQLASEMYQHIEVYLRGHGQW